MSRIIRGEDKENGAAAQDKVSDRVLNHYEYDAFGNTISCEERVANRFRYQSGSKADTKRLGVQPENCLVFEDIPAGIMAGKAAGMPVIAVEDDFSADLMDEKRALADAVISDYRELL